MTDPITTPEQAIEAAAQWHSEQMRRAEETAGRQKLATHIRRWDAIADHHEESAAAIRALASRIPAPDGDVVERVARAIAGVDDRIADQAAEIDGWRTVAESNQQMAQIEQARATAAESERDRLRGLLWYGWKEMNAIRAMSGVPLDFYGTAQGIMPEYWSSVVDAMEAALGDDAKPWPSDAARAALEPPR